ncbi:MAG: hypothetical protein WBQ95_07000, partial [Terracidiphilus sp.]
MSEFLRIEQRGAEVNQQQDRKQKSDYSDEVHGLPQLLTGLYVQKGSGKENGGEEEHREILHASTLDSEHHAATWAHAIPKSILRVGALLSRKGNLKEI